MLKIINDLFKLNRTLVGDGFDKALQYIKKILPEMEILEFPSGMEYGTWTIPQKWEVKDAWVKYKNKKIIDFKKDPLSLVVGSEPIHGVVKIDELREHLFHNPQKPDVIPYVFKYYDKDWGFSTSTDNYLKLKNGDYEVFIDSKYTDGVMKIGQYVLRGGQKEILIMVHLDHPFQANDNLSSVAVAIELAKSLKSKYTIKILFTPETIGAMAYAYTQDLDNVDFGIAIDMVGNDNTILMQETFGGIEKINKAGAMAMSILSPLKYRKAPFRAPLGADEYIMNDPLIGVPMIFFSRSPYNEYHSESDTPDIIKEDKLKETIEIIKKTIKIIEEDWTPKRNFKGALMRSKYGVQQLAKEENRKYDYFFYLMDGKRSVLDLSYACQLNFEKMNNLLKKLKKDGFISTNIQK